MSSLADQKFSVGDVVVDSRANLIVISGKEKRVEPKLIALLVYLAQHSKEVITRQQITEVLWPNVVVGDESVTQAIFALRNLLRDDAKQPQYIETIPKKGYRFLAEANLLDTKTTETPTPQQPSKNKLVLISSLISLSLVAVFILIWFFVWKTPYGKIVNILPATKMEGVEGDMAINRNHQMVFINSSLAEGAGRLFLKDLKTGVQERISGDEWFIAAQPVWLDDTTLLYSRCKFNSECQIVRQKLREQAEVLYESNTGAIEAMVRPDQPDELFFNEASKEDFGVFNVRTGKYELLRDRYSHLPNHISHPQFSKDGKKLYFIYKFEQTKLMVLDLTTGAIKTVSEQFEELHSVSFNHQQELMIAGNINSVPGLWFLNPEGGEPRLFLRSVSGELYVRAAAAPNEPAIYCQTVRLNIDNVIVDQGKDVTNELPDLNSTGLDSGAILSHDEQSIYFMSNRSGFAEIWRYDLTQKQAKPVTQIKTALIEYLSLSHNGQRIAAIYMEKSQLVTGIFSTFTGELLAQSSAKLMPFNWSYDDESIYAVDMKNDEKKLFRMNSQTLEITEIQNNAGLYAEEFDNGQSLIFYSFDKKTFVKRNLANGEDKILASSITLPQLGYHLPRLDSTGESVFTVYRDAKRYQTVQYPFNAKADNNPRILFDIPQNTDRITHINRAGTKALTSRLISADGDMLKIELAH